MPRLRLLWAGVLVAGAVSLPTAVAAAGPSALRSPDLREELLARDEALMRRTRLGLVALALFAVAAGALALRARALESRLQAALRRHEDDLDGVIAMTRTVARSDEPAELLGGLLRQALLFVPEAERAVLLLLEEGGGRYRVVAAEGAGRDGVLDATLDAEEALQLLVRGGEALGERAVRIPRPALAADDEGGAVAVQLRVSGELHFLLLESIAGDGLEAIDPHRLGVLREHLVAAVGRVRLGGELVTERARAGAALAALERSQAELERVARTDPSTGLPNRREALERLTAEWRRIGRYGRGCTVILADLDTFRELNDEFGPECGDYAVVEVGRTLRRLLRDQDTAARWGDEEYLVLLPETELAGGVLVAERIRAAVAESDFMWRGNLVRVTLSLGVTELSALRSPAEAIGLADAALQRAKLAGRDRVQVMAGRGGNATGAGASAVGEGGADSPAAPPARDEEPAGEAGKPVVGE